jgi:NAD(P)H-hydrate repair Nnr-like enzyme with NAD(P)H-hydrate dehydratase domain
VYSITDAGTVVAVLASAQQAAVADADALTVVAQLNALLAKLRTVGIIAT